MTCKAKSNTFSLGVEDRVPNLSLGVLYYALVCHGLNYVPQISYVKDLTPTTSQGDLIWK